MTTNPATQPPAAVAAHTPRTVTVYKIVEPDSASKKPTLETMEVRKWRHGYKVFKASFSPAPDFIPHSVRIAGACETPAAAWQWYIELQLCRAQHAREKEAMAMHREKQARAALAAAKA